MDLDLEVALARLLHHHPPFIGGVPQGLHRHQVARCPGGDDLGGVFGVGGPGQQVIGVVQRHEALRVPGRLEDRRGVVDAHGLVARRMQHE